MRTQRVLGWSLACLPGVLTEHGDLDEAVTAARAGFPLLLDDGAFAFVTYLGLRAALVGRLADAARLAGYSDGMWAKQEIARHPSEERPIKRLRSLLVGSFAPFELQRLLDEGATLSEAEACELGLRA
jgi:hypothetical protein